MNSNATQNPFDAVALADLRRRTSVKWQLFGPDVLPLWVAEMDVMQPEPVIRAVTDALRLGDTGYDYGPAYAEVFAEFAWARYGWEVDVAATRTVPDVMQGIVAMLDIVTDRGDAVVITPPVYPPFVHFTEHAGRRIELAPLDRDGRLDFEALDSAFARATEGGRRAAFLLCNPHNPTGVLHRREELEALGALAQKHGVRVVSDEIHAPFVLDRSAGAAKFVPITTVIPNAFALHSASKAFNLAGLKGALAVAGPEAVADLAKMSGTVGDGVSHMSMIAQAAALREGRDWFDTVLDALQDNMILLEGLLAEHLPQARWVRNEATYLAWLDLREMPAVLAGAEPAELILKRGRVALNSGADFGEQGRGFVRMNLATSSGIVREAVERIAGALR